MINAIILALAGFGGVSGTYFAFKKNKEDSLNLKQCFLERIATPLLSSFNEFHSNSIFLIDYVKDDYIICNTPNPNLYGIEISSNSTIPNYINHELIQRLIRDFTEFDNAYFFYCIYKKEKYQKQYIFSHNSTLIKTIANYFNVKLLSGNELINVLYNLYLQNTFFIKDKQIHQSIVIDKKQDVEKEPEFMGFKRLAKQAILKNLNEVDLFQGYKNIQVNTSDIQKLFKVNFEGEIWFYIDITKRSIRSQIQKLINYSKMVGDKKPFLALKDKFESGGETLALINSIMLLKNYDEEAIGEIGSYLKTSYLHRELFRTNILNKMPIKYRDSEFDFLVKSSFLENFIASVHKRSAKKPDIFGLDKNSAFVNFSFSEENDNPHSVIIAKPGSGKSVSKQKIMAQMIGLDFSNGYCTNLGSEPENVKIRSYDIGFSDEKFINLIKSNEKNKVAHIQAEFSDFSYNLININYESDEAEITSDLEFMADLANIILSTQNAKPMEISESGYFKKIVRLIYKEKLFDKKRIINIKTSNTKIYEELLELGYNNNDFLGNIKEEQYSFLGKPLLTDVIKFANLQSENKQKKEEEREIYSNLTNKLRSIESLNIFSNFDKVDIANADVISMDLNNFKESSLFVPIFFCIFQKIYLKDRQFALECKRKNRPAPKLFYAIEEAKNYFRDNPIFEAMFDKVTLEARKYNVHLCFIIQNAEHIPFGILKNIDTRIFLLRPDKRNEVIQEANSCFNIPDNVKEALNNTELYELCVWYSKGVLNMKFEINNEEMKIFSTNPNG